MTVLAETPIAASREGSSHLAIERRGSDSPAIDRPPTPGASDAGARLAPALPRQRDRADGSHRRVIVERIYGGDCAKWRSHGRKNTSFRKLSSHPDLPFHASQLSRAVSIYLLSQRRPELAQFAHVGPSHLQEILGLEQEGAGSPAPLRGASWLDTSPSGRGSRLLASRGPIERAAQTSFLSTMRSAVERAHRIGAPCSPTSTRSATCRRRRRQGLLAAVQASANNRNFSPPARSARDGSGPPRRLTTDADRRQSVPRRSVFIRSRVRARWAPWRSWESLSTLEFLFRIDDDVAEWLSTGPIFSASPETAMIGVPLAHVLGDGLSALARRVTLLISLR